MSQLERSVVLKRGCQDCMMLSGDGRQERVRSSSSKITELEMRGIGFIVLVQGSTVESSRYNVLGN